MNHLPFAIEAANAVSTAAFYMYCTVCCVCVLQMAVCPTPASEGWIATAAPMAPGSVDRVLSASVEMAPTVKISMRCQIHSKNTEFTVYNMLINSGEIPAQWPCGRVYALSTGGRGFAPRPSHTKDFKNGTQISLALHSAKRDGLGGASYHHPKLVAPCPGCGAHQAVRRFNS